MGITDLNNFLAWLPSFLGPGPVAAVDTNMFIDDIRTVRDDATPVGARCGGYIAFPDGIDGGRVVRAIVQSARRLYQLECAEIATPPPPPAVTAEDPFKPLAPKTLSDLWEAGAIVTDGYSSVPDRFKLSDALVSRMVRANKAGEFWIPAIDSSFSYKDPSSNRVITTLLKSSGEGPVPGAEIQLVQGAQQSERFDPVDLAADYNDCIMHRSAAIITAYCTPQASTDYVASPRFRAIDRHRLVTTSPKPARMLIPTFLAALERQLRAAARLGLSATVLLRIDSAVVRAILDRQATIHVDGNLAIEYVCEQCTHLFTPPRVLLDLQSLHGGAGSDIGSIGPSASQILSPAGKPSQRERSLQSENDKLRHQLGPKRTRFESDAGNSSARSETTQRNTTYGGDGRRTGGGVPTSRAICDAFNAANGCFRRECKFRHACNVMNRNGSPCGAEAHCALHHK
jgi:hypothetical protein